MASRETRLTSIDVFRGITVAGMLLVNNPGDPANVFAPLRHSVWNGWTPTDLVFPFFLFLVGVTTELSMSRHATDGDDSSVVRRAIFRRAAKIFALGLLLNAYPFFEKSAVAGAAWLPSPFGHVLARLAQLRLMGVLQRIALAYLIGSLIARAASTRRVAITAGALLLAYWGAMTLLPVPDQGTIGAHVLNEPGRTLSAWVDRVTLDWTAWGLGWHMWDANVPYDPEGLLSTVPAIATVLFGVLAGRWLQSPRSVSERLSALCAVGALAMVVAAVWNWVLPINKPIWSSSYALFTAGFACLSLGTVSWIVDAQQSVRWSTPFLVFGTNPIAAYVGSELLANILRSSIKIPVDGHHLATGLAFARGVEALGAHPAFASLLWAIAFVALCYALLTPLYRRKIFLRV